MFVRNYDVTNAVILDGNGTKTVVVGDALKIGFTKVTDPFIDVRMYGNVDTNTYKILAIKVKKDFNQTTTGEVFYNSLNGGADANKSVKFNYTASTDWQWIYINLGSRSAGNVGYIRFDVFENAPSLNAVAHVACFAFFKSQADAEAYAASQAGQDLGKNVVDANFPAGQLTTTNASQNTGAWLNKTMDGKPGYYWMKFNANSTFRGIYFFSYAGNDPANVVWKLYKYYYNLEATLKTEPVATGQFNTISNHFMYAGFPVQDPGQYLFYLEYKGGSHFVIGGNATPVGADKIEVGTNGAFPMPTLRDLKYMMANILFDANSSNVYFNPIVADTEAPVTEPTTEPTTEPGTEPIPETGDVALIGYAAVALVTVLFKKKEH